MIPPMNSSVAWDRLTGGVLDELFGESGVEVDASALDFGDRYTLEDQIGEGGQAKVYRGYDHALQRQVAIKCLGNAHLEREALLLARLAHTAIPQVYDQGRMPDGSHFVIMELIEGERLDHYLRERQPDLQARVHLFREVAEAVGHAHDRGIIHRDIKPSNIQVRSDGRPCLLDWGLAATGDPRAICGSPHFAAPEQLEGQPADRRSDIYALGVLLYVILGDALPYAREVTDFNEFRQVRAGLRRVPLQRRKPEVPPALNKVCERAMAAHAAVRYADTATMVVACEAALQQPRRSWRGRAVRWGIMVVLIVLAWFAGRMQEHRSPEPVVSDPQPAEDPADIWRELAPPSIWDDDPQDIKEVAP